MKNLFNPQIDLSGPSPLSTGLADLDSPSLQPAERETRALEVLPENHTMEEEDKYIADRLGNYDNNGLPTEDYLNFLGTSDVAVKYGLTKPRPDSLLSNFGHGLTKSYHSSIRGFAKSFGAEDEVKRRDEILRTNQQWNLSPDEDISGWMMYQAATGLGTSAPTIAVGAGLATIPAISLPLVATAMGTVVFAQTIGDDLEQVRKDSGGMLDPYTELAAGFVIGGIKAAIETGLGPQKFLAGALAKRALAKFSTEQSNRFALREFGKMIYEGRAGKLLAATAEEGGEEVLQLGSYDIIMNQLTGREFSAPSEYRENFLAGAVGGAFLGLGGITLNSIAESSAKETVKAKLVAPVTEDTQKQIYTDTDVVQRQQAMLKTQQSFQAFKSTLPTMFQPIASLIETVAYNMSAMEGGVVKPEQYVDTLKTVFLADMTASKAKQLNSMIQGKNEAEVIDVLRKEVDGFDGMVQNTQDKLHHNMVKTTNDRVEQDLKRSYTPVQKNNESEFKNFLSVVFGKTVIDKLWGQNVQTQVIPFEDIRSMGLEGKLPQDTMQSLIAEGRVNGVDVEDNMGRKFKVDFSFNDDFSVTISRARIEAETKEVEIKEEAAITERGKLQQSLKQDLLGPSNIELDIAREVLREIRLAKKGQVLSEFKMRWDEFLNGKDIPSTTKEMARRLVTLLDDARKERTKGILQNEEVDRAIDEVLKILERKQLTGKAIQLPGPGVLEQQEWDRKVTEAYALAAKAARGLPPHVIITPEEGTIGGYDLRKISQMEDPASELIKEIDRNRQGGDIEKWRKDQFNGIALKLGVKLKGMSDTRKANTILLAISPSETGRANTKALFDAIDKQFPSGVFNSQTDDTVKGQYLQSNKLAVFYKEADAETIVHEWFHHLTRNGLMPSRMQSALFNSFAVDGKWTDASDENAVSSFMSWMSTQELPQNATPELITAFTGLKKIISKAYQKVAGTQTQIKKEIKEGEQKIEEVGQKQIVEVSPEVQEAFAGLLDPIDDNTVESIYGEALAEAMENSTVANNPPMSDEEFDERINLSLEGKVLNQKVKTKKQNLWAKLHAQYGSHEKVVEALGMKEGQTVKDLSVKKMREALKRDTGRELEWLQRKGFPDGSIKELKARSPEGAHFAERELEDETTKLKPTKLHDEKKLSVAEKVAPIAEELAKEQLSAVSWAPRVLTSDVNQRVQQLKNSAHRWSQRIVHWGYGLRDISKFLGEKFNNEVWGRLQEPNNEISKEQNKVDDEYMAKMTSEFLANTANTVALPSGIIMPVNDMIALYAMTEGKNITAGNLFNKEKEMNPWYSDVIAWMGANNEGDTEVNMLKVLNEAVDYINSNADIKAKVITELDYTTKVSNEYFDKAAKKYKEITGEKLNRLNKRWYTSLTRSNDVLHEGDVSSVFENLDGRIPAFKGINLPSAFNERFGGKGGFVSLDYRNNFHHHIYAMINYEHKAGIIKDVMSIIRNPAFVVAMQKRFGGKDASIINALDVLVRREMSPSGKWKKDEGVGDTFFGQMRVNVYNSLLSWNIGMFPMQLTSWPMAFSEFGLNGKTLTQMVKNTLWTMQKIISGTIKAGRNPSIRGAFKGWSVWENMLKYGAPITRRISNPDAENMRRRSRESWIAKNFKYSHEIIEHGNKIMEAGDMSGVIPAWNTMFEMKREQLAREHSEWTEEQINNKAGLIATDTVMAIQSPSIIGEKSLWQTGSELEKMQIPFSGQAFTVMKSLLNNQIIPIIEAIKRSETTGDIAKNVGKVIMNKQYATKVLVGWILPAIAMGAVARRRRQKDKTEMAGDILCYALGTIPIIGNMIWMSVALGWDNGNAATFYHDLFQSTVTGIKGAVTGDEVGVRRVGKVAAMIAGSPIALNRIIENAIKRYQEHDSSFTGTEILETLGWKTKD